MPKTRSHVSRKYFGEKEAHELIAWLNRFGRTRRGQPVLKLWEAVNDYRGFLLKNREVLGAIVARGLGMRPEFYIGVDPESMRRFRRLAEKATQKLWREMLRAYKLSGARAANVDFARELTRRNMAENLLAPTPEQSYEKKTTSQAAFDLVVLTYQPAFDRIRQCLCCPTLFYARFKHKKFCSAKCQQTFYKKSPEWRAHRAEWMREYRMVKAKPNIK